MIYRENLDKAQCSSCSSEHDHKKLFLSPACHPGKGVFCSYEDGALTIVCSICGKPITQVAVAGQSTTVGEDTNYLFLEGWQDECFKPEELQVTGKAVFDAVMRVIEHIRTAMENAGGSGNVQLDISPVLQRVFLDLHGNVEKNRFLLLILDKFLLLASILGAKRYFDRVDGIAPTTKATLDSWIDDILPVKFLNKQN